MALGNGGGFRFLRLLKPLSIKSPFSSHPSLTFSTERAEKEGKFKHWVKFDFGPLEHPDYGRFHIKSKFPRTPPRHQRPKMTPEETEKIFAFTRAYVDRFWDREGKEAEYERVIDGSSLWAIYTTPRPPIFSKLMEINLNYNYWVFYVDDELEIAIRENISAEALISFFDQCLDILRGKYDVPNPAPFKEIPNFPKLKGLWEVALDIHRNCIQHVENYLGNLGDLYIATQRYFDVFMCTVYEQPATQYSPLSFQLWRGVDSANELCVEFAAVLQGILVAPRIRQHPYFVRVMEMAGIGGWINDVLGMRKTCFEPDLNSLTGYHLMKGGASVEEAVERVCDAIAREWSDYYVYKRNLLKQFDNDKMLSDYFDVLEANADGMVKVYMHSKRYYAVAGSIEMV